MIVQATDPGSVTSGLIVRDGRDCLAVELVERGEDWPSYFDAVLQAFADLYAEFKPQLYAVEGCVAPTPHLGMTAVAPLLDTAQVLGALRMTFQCYVIPPAGFGKVPDDLLNLPGERGRQACRDYLLANYPAELVRPRTFRGDNDDLRHCRSAWDVAGAAERQTRQQQIGGLR